MSDYIVKAMSDLTSNVSFGGGGGGGGIFSVSIRPAITTANTIAGATGHMVNQNPRDPQGVWGRPTLNEGDSYSGLDTYGGPAGR